MKKFAVLPFLFLFGILSAQNLEGAWELVEVDAEPVTAEETIRIYQDGYFATGTKDAVSNSFLRAEGGTYDNDKEYVEQFDFHTADTSLVGAKLSYEFSGGDDEFTITNNNGSQTWKRISDNENDLSGNWVITGRERNGEMARSTPGARRTIKILGGDRFQWVAFNSDTKEFYGTGGGTYSSDDGRYTENISFFSRDDSRVGAVLSFDYEVENGEWHHRGKSSKGDPIYEIWSPYSEAYLKSN